MSPATFYDHDSSIIFECTRIHALRKITEGTAQRVLSKRCEGRGWREHNNQRLHDV